MNREQKFLQIINSTLSKKTHLGDDCAYLVDLGIVITQDSLIEGVHFDLSFISPYQLGKKAMLVNLSDVLASGAKPRYFTISLSGNLEENFIEEFYKGVNEICDKFNVEIVGGDLTSGEKISISICAIGNCNGRKISSRKNAEKGYVVAVRGIFGASALGLKELKQGEFKGRFAKNHLEPELFVETSEIIATNCQKKYALMDSSDGLYDCLKQIGEKSGVKINVEFEKIPRANENFNTTFFGGEDFALVGAFFEDDFIKINKAGGKLIKIGETQKGCGIFSNEIEIKKDLGYEHF